jgi:succinoglycan biosynthesis transport protein ExoP
VELTYYVRVLRRNWHLLALIVVVCLVGAAAAAWSRTSLYTTSTSLVATSGQGDSLPGGTTPSQAAGERASLLAQFVPTAPVEHAAVAAASRASGIPAHLPAQVQATADGTNPFLTITVTDPSPRWAQAVANAYRTAMPGALTSVDPAVAAAARQLNVLTQAGLPNQPSSPNRTQYLLMGLLLGVVLGLGVVVLREALDRQVREPEDVGRALAMPVLGGIPQEDAKRPLPMRSAPHSARAEAYRAVLANLPFLNNSDDLPQQIMVTGTASGEGVSTLAANLAVALARSGRRVVLVDANLRRPRLHEIFDVPASPGLAELLADSASFDDVVHVLDGGALRVMTAGELPEDPVERLTSSHATDVLAHLEKYCDVVIFDTPPVVPVADALFLVRQVSAVVLNTRVRITKKDQLRRAGDALHQVRAPVAGVVVTGTTGQADRLRPSRRHGRAPVARLMPAGDATPLLPGLSRGTVPGQDPASQI